MLWMSLFLITFINITYKIWGWGWGWGWGMGLGWGLVPGMEFGER